jgi:hypothetical protein
LGTIIGLPARGLRLAPCDVKDVAGMWDELGLPAGCDGIEAKDVVGCGRDGAEHEGWGEANELGGGVEAGKELEDRLEEGEWRDILDGPFRRPCGQVVVENEGVEGERGGCGDGKKACRCAH